MPPAVPKKLILGRFRGATSAEILYRQKAKPSQLDYFSYRFYPSSRATCQLQASRLAQLRHFENHVGTVHLNDRIVVSFIVPIAKTSKSAVIRRRLMHRLSAAFRAGLQDEGPKALPKLPVNYVLSPRMTVLLAPFRDLQKDVLSTYLEARDSFERLSQKKKEGIGHSRSKSASPRSRRPELRGDKFDLAQKIRQLEESIRPTAYVKSHGGPVSLLKRIQECDVNARTQGRLPRPN